MTQSSKSRDALDILGMTVGVKETIGNPETINQIVQRVRNGGTYDSFQTEGVIVWCARLDTGVSVEVRVYRPAT